MNKLTLQDLDLNNKKVLMRVDFNIPLKNDGIIADDSRIQAALQSINYILDHNASLILISHLGRPKGKKEPALSLKPVAKRLEQLLGKTVIMAPDCIGEEVEELAKKLQPKQVLLLENIRYYDAEEHPEKDSSFAKKLSSLADVYVNDAFGTAHRSHSSTATVAKYFPKTSACGFLMQQEIEFLDKCIKNPKRPFYAIIGGAKISTKIGIIAHLIKKVDAIFIGGGMSYTFLKAQNIPIGNSLYEEDQVESIRKLIETCKKENFPLYLPIDIVIADSFSNDAKKHTVSVSKGVPSGFMGLDIGPKTINKWESIIKHGATIFWNGPMGVFEFPNFAEGTQKMAKIISETQATTIVGGGDSVRAIHELELQDKFTHLSTGGGASLKYIEYETLPGIEALSDK